MKIKLKLTDSYKIILALVVCVIAAGAYITIKEITHPPKTFDISGQVDNYSQDWPRKDKMKGSPYSSQFDGLDISQFQGRIDWDSLKTENHSLQFVFVRAIGYGGVFDKVYRSQVNEAVSRGIPVGSYIFFTMRLSARKQFELFREIVEKDKQTLRPVIDIEDRSLFLAKGENLKDSVMVLAKLMEDEYGCKPIIYSNEHHYENNLSPEFDDYPLWIANYACEPKLPNAKPVLWQYSERGHAHGIWTHVDLDRFVNGGTMDDIRL